MDPDEALRVIREQVATLGSRGRPYPPARIETLLYHLRGLDDWLTKGGFLPGPWREGRLLVPAPAYDDDANLDEHTARVRRHAVYGVQKDGQALCTCGVMLPEAEIDQHVTESNPKENA